MQFQVPQFIETEDKIIGPLTLRQFGFLAAAAGISLMLFFAVTPFVWIVFTVVLAGIGGAIAFVKINGQKMEKIVISAAQYYWNPQTYVWQPDQPDLQKSPNSIRERALRSTLERILSGRALKKAWRSIETGTPEKRKKQKTERPQEQFMVLKKPTGERRAVKRVDYR